MTRALLLISALAALAGATLGEYCYTRSLGASKGYTIEAPTMYFGPGRTQFETKAVENCGVYRRDAIGVSVTSCSEVGLMIAIPKLEYAIIFAGQTKGARVYLTSYCSSAHEPELPGGEGRPTAGPFTTDT